MKSMNILIIGQCSLHWGRMEFGNIGNYYIIEPFFRQLHNTFEHAEIKTTMQLSERFQRAEQVKSLPLNLYYDWRDNELQLSDIEVELSEEYKRTGILIETTEYIEQVKWADLVIDFSGDIWGDNANFLGKDRFNVGLNKVLTAQNMGKKTAMLAGSPGPFGNEVTKRLAKKIYKSFDIVTNREPISTDLLNAEGFDCSKTHTLPCPAFLFEAAQKNSVEDTVKVVRNFGGKKEKPVVGFIICGWNFEKGPFDKWPRNDEEYDNFVESVEFICGQLGARVCLMSHSNGFDIPPLPFKLKHGRDYPIAKQLQSILLKRGIAKDIVCIDELFEPWETKALIGTFDMLVTGRVHAAVAAFAQSIPTVVIDYGHEPKAHKLKGFAKIVGALQYVAQPSDQKCLKGTILHCWDNRKEYKHRLLEAMPAVKKQANKHFDLLRSIEFE